MRLNFSSEQTHQLKAVESVVDLFITQPRQEDSFHIFDGEFVIDNRMEELEPSQLLHNLQNIQKRNGVEVDNAVESYDFSIEMETGTGKTYTYIRTMMELFQNYGWKKYMVIVPSIAIREGVKASLQNMQEHFLELYGVRYNTFEYDSAQVSQVKHYVRDDTIQIMVITIDAFKRDDTVMKQEIEGFVGTPLEVVAQTRPIVILDEPQNMESTLSKEAINQLTPLFVLRYSATHKNLYHLLYSLSPKQALEDGLVKQIDVFGFEESQQVNEQYVSVQEIRRGKDKKPFAKLEVIELQKEQLVKKTKTIKGGDDLKSKTKNPLYSGYVVREINFAEKFIEFENGIKLDEAQSSGLVHREIQKEQMRTAIAKHMERYEALKERGIKVLSLFFIDRVANYLEEEGGWIEPFFVEEFERQRASYKSFADKQASDVYAHYFAKRKKGYVDEIKNSQSDKKLQKEMYSLIMQKKEQLLRFDEDVSFIFSHSALKEGWDNPNVFFITTLNEAHNDTRKRQIIGRGVRIAVNQQGERVFGKDINRLTVIANESFDQFAKTLQLEYSQAGQEGGQVNNDRERKKSVIRSKVLLSPEFKKIWRSIRQKTTYSVSVQSDTLIESAVEKLNAIEVLPPKIVAYHAEVDSDHDSFIDSEKYIELKIEQQYPDIIKELCDDTGLTRKTVQSILEQVDLTGFVNNAELYIKKASVELQNVCARFLSEGITYEKSDEKYRLKNVFECEFKGYGLVENKTGLYTAMPSDSTVEEKFIECADKRFAFFTKLPKRFTIPTPLGPYNPDFAIVKNDGTKSCFVIETKGTEDESQRSEKENLKIKCATEHFDKLDTIYRVKKECSDVI